MQCVFVKACEEIRGSGARNTGCGKVSEVLGAAPGRSQGGSRGQEGPVCQKAKGRGMFAPALGMRPLDRAQKGPGHRPPHSVSIQMKSPTVGTSSLLSCGLVQHTMIGKVFISHTQARRTWWDFNKATWVDDERTFLCIVTERCSNSGGAISWIAIKPHSFECDHFVVEIEKASQATDCF